MDPALKKVCEEKMNDLILSIIVGLFVSVVLVWNVNTVGCGIGIKNSLMLIDFYVVSIRIPFLILALIYFNKYKHNSNIILGYYVMTEVILAGIALYNTIQYYSPANDCADKSYSLYWPMWLTVFFGFYVLFKFSIFSCCLCIVLPILLIFVGRNN